MPHYAAALKGEKNVLEDIAPCFNTALSTIRRRDTNGFWNHRISSDANP